MGAGFRIFEPLRREDRHDIGTRPAGGMATGWIEELRRGRVRIGTSFQKNCLTAEFAHGYS